MNVRRWLSEIVSRRPYLVARLLTYLFVLTLLHSVIPLLRFSWRLPNVLFFLFSLPLPWIALVVVGRYGSNWRRTVFVLVLAPLLAFTLLAGPATTMYLNLMVSQGKDPVFERIHTVSGPDYEVVVYRTNFGGIISPYGIDVRQERPVMPGLLMVRRLVSASPAAEASVEFVAPNVVQVEVEPYGPQYERQGWQLKLKRHVYLF